MNVDDFLRQILKIYIKKNDNNYSDGFVISIYPDKNVKIKKDMRELTISTKSKCKINYKDYLKKSDEELVEVIIKIDGIKEKLLIKKKYLQIKNYTLSKL